MFKEVKDKEVKIYEVAEDFQISIWIEYFQMTMISMNKKYRIKGTN